MESRRPCLELYQIWKEIETFILVVDQVLEILGDFKCVGGVMEKIGSDWTVPHSNLSKVRRC